MAGTTLENGGTQAAKRKRSGLTDRQHPALLAILHAKLLQTFLFAYQIGFAPKIIER